MYDMLKRKIGGIREEVVNLAAELVRVPSPSLQEDGVAKQVRGAMEALGYDRVLADDYGNIIGILYGRDPSQTVLVNAHMDTVAPEACQWKADPFAGDIVEGRLRGAGAADCKGGLSAAIFAGAVLKRSLLPLRGNLVVAATVAEEQGGGAGVRHLVEDTLASLEIKPTYAVLAEPTNLGIYRGHTGWAQYQIVVQGANPFEVDDAAQAIFREFAARQDEGAVAGRAETHRVQRPRFETSNGFRRGVIGLSHRLQGEDDSSAAGAALRRQAVRVAEGVSQVSVDVTIPRTLQRLYTNHTTLTETRVEAWSTDAYHPLVERARQVLAAAGMEPRVGKWSLPRIGMGTAGSVLSREFRVPTIGFGPGVEQDCHAANESVPVANIVDATYGLAAICHGLVGIPVCGWTADEI